jgi:aldose 1-epimerase
MWKIDEIKNANSRLDCIHVANNRMSSRIYPNLGGSLQELIVEGTSVIDGIRSDESGLKDYNSTFKSSILFPFPNRVKDGIFGFGEHVYQLDINDLIFKNAIHGLVYDAEFDYEIFENSSGNLLVKLSLRKDGSEAGFPFSYDLDLIYTFDPSGNVSLGIEARNTGFQTFPFGIGWHPYFLSSDLDNSSISAKFEDHFLCPERMIPQEKEEAQLDPIFLIADQSFDDGYSLSEASCKIETPDYEISLEFETGSKPYLQIYTPDHRNSIAIEPMTCVTDALNNGVGLEALDPGETCSWLIQMNIRIKS